MKLAVITLALFFALAPIAAQAQLTTPGGTCTDNPQFNTNQSSNPGIVTNIASQVTQTLGYVSSTLFNNIVSSESFIDAIGGALTIYILIYGTLFMVGMVPMTMSDFAMRMVKIGIIVWLMQPRAWRFFSLTVVQFFGSGTDSIINELAQIGVGGIYATPTDPSQPASGIFNLMDQALGLALSPKIWVTILATFTTGPYGPIFGILFVLALGFFFKSMLTAVWVYLMSKVLQALLFGIAPIFLACLLFDRTRHLFQGWLNQLVNTALQPIMLFAFFAFFVTLITTAMQGLLPPVAPPVCWTEVIGGVRASPTKTYYWRFEVPGSSNATSYEQYHGLWSFNGADTVSSDTASVDAGVFPLSIMSVLIFLLLAELGVRFSEVVLMIAQDIAGASTDLSAMSGALSDIFSPKRSTGGAGEASQSSSTLNSLFGSNRPGPAGGARTTPGGGVGTTTYAASTGNAATGPSSRTSSGAGQQMGSLVNIRPGPGT